MNEESHLGGARAWLVWSLSAMAFGYAFFQRVAPGVMVSDLMSEFAIGGGMLGVLSALYFYPYVVLQVPLGALLDRWGARSLLVLALGIAGVGSFVFGSAETLAVAYIGRILIGIGSCVGFLGSLALAARWFPKKRFTMLAGLTMFFGMMSGVLAQAPLAIFVQNYGWRASQWGLGFFGVGLAVLIFIFVRNAPTDKQTKKTTKPGMASIWYNLVRTARIKEVWKLAIVAAAMSGPMLTLGGLWGTPYLMAAYGLGRAEAAFFISFMLFGWAFGAPFAGWFSDHLQKRKSLLICGSFGLSVALALIILFPGLPLFGVVALLAFAGFSGGGMAICFGLLRQMVPDELFGSASGIVNGMTVASGAILQPLVGLVLDVVWDGEVAAGSRLYSETDYRIAFIFVLGSALLGLVVSLMLREKPE